MKVYSVSQINTYIKNMFAQDFLLNRVSIRGEVSNCKYHSSGHIYFSLKDVGGNIACVMFAGARKGLAFRMVDGQQIVVDGSISVYERDGKYQLYANRIRLDGAGLLYERFLALKQELEEMGMFAQEYKKPIPRYVKRIGVITAPTGAAIQDIISISTRRNPGVQLYLYPAKVQGEGAAESIAHGLEMMDALSLDVLIVGRGGGSIEDLWAFNEEIVARAIFSCSTPVISGVGHETDTTIADYVADLRAPTPSAAAELANADMRAVLQYLDSCQDQLLNRMEDRIRISRQRLLQFQNQITYVSPAWRIREQKKQVSDMERALKVRMEQTLQNRRHQMAVFIERMKGVSPLNKLEQGYAAVTDSQGKRLYSVSQVQEDSMIDLYVSDGKIQAKVLGTEQVSG